VAKTLYLSSQNTIDCYKLFCSISKFLITSTTFFLSWNISIIPLISITYRVLVHNYNTIKYICFISPCQHVGMWSSLKKTRGDHFYRPWTPHSGLNYCEFDFLLWNLCDHLGSATLTIPCWSRTIEGETTHKQSVSSAVSHRKSFQSRYSWDLWLELI
jgi:hypothetical protein